MIRFILNSFIFKKSVKITVVFIVIFLAANYTFDYFWSATNSLMLTNLDDEYKPPAAYDDITRIKLKLQDLDKVYIEGNRKFKLVESGKDYDYYDTVFLKFPEETSDKLNKYFLKFENSQFLDSFHVVVTRSPEKKGYYWKQIFFSSVQVEELNDFKNPKDFRIENKILVDNELLKDNDTLITQAYRYFNENIKSLQLADCGTNCYIFEDICRKFNIPVRIITLQGGDDRNEGYNDNLGYPLHRICELYSSKLKKWFVIDPTFGVIYTYNGEPLSAVEISSRVFFNKMTELSQDSVLVTKKILLDRDYFKYYENIYFFSKYRSKKYTDLPLQFFYAKFMPFYIHYSSNIDLTKNAYFYIGLKTVMFVFIFLAHFNLIMYLFFKRLLSVKKTPKNNKYDRKYFLTG